MVVVLVFSNGLYYYSEVLGSLPLLAFRRDVDNAIFLKYSNQGRSFEIFHQTPVMTIIQNISRCYLKNKAGVRCAKRTPDAVALNVK